MSKKTHSPPNRDQLQPHLATAPALSLSANQINPLSCFSTKRQPHCSPKRQSRPDDPQGSHQLQSNARQSPSPVRHTPALQNSARSTCNCHRKLNCVRAKRRRRRDASPRMPVDEGCHANPSNPVRPPHTALQNSARSMCNCPPEKLNCVRWRRVGCGEAHGCL